MNLSPEQIAANRKSAINLALTQSGLNDKPKSDWTFEERGNYNKTLAGIIAKNPDAFDPQDVITAKDIEKKDYSPLASTDFSFSDFGDEIGNNANNLVGKPLVNLGNAVSNAANILGSAGPYLAVAGALWVGYMFFKRKAASA